MPFETHDREFTAQIQRNRVWVPEQQRWFKLNEWRGCGNTTFLTHEPVVSGKLFDADAYAVRATIRAHMLYGASVSRPNIKLTDRS